MWKGILHLIHTETDPAHRTGSLASPSRELIAQPGEDVPEVWNIAQGSDSWRRGLFKFGNYQKFQPRQPALREFSAQMWWSRGKGVLAVKQCHTGSFMKYAKSTNCSSNQNNRAFVNSQTVWVIFYFPLFLRHDKFFPMRNFQNIKTKADQIQEGPGVSIKCHVLRVTSSMKGK